MSPAIARLIAEAAANPKGFNPASGHTMLLSHPNARTQQSPSSPPAPLPTTHSPSRPPMPTPTPHATATASYGPPPGMQAHAHARMPGMPGMPMPMQMQMPQMGSAPPVRPGIVLTGPPDPRLVLVNEPGSARATSFRVLRDNLLARGLPRVLAVSSAAKGDGKTTCAVNLALSLSERARVLLLDGNFAEPGLTALFEITELTPVSRLHGPWLAPYTVVDLSPTLAVSTLLVREGMASPRFEKWAFEQLIVSLRRMPIDFVIIDTAAVSTSPSVGQLLGSVDATLLTVRAGVTTARALRRATDVIPEGRGIGIALVDTNPG